MANEQNLRPVPITTTEQAKRLGRKGGSAITDKKKYAAQLREIKKRVKKGNLKTTDEKWLLDRVENQRWMALDLITYIDSVKGELTGGQNIPLINAYAKAMQIIHGSKTPDTQVNLQVNDSNVIINIVDPNKKDGKENR